MFDPNALGIFAGLDPKILAMLAGPLNLTQTPMTNMVTAGQTAVPYPNLLQNLLSTIMNFNPASVPQLGAQMPAPAPAGASQTMAPQPMLFDPSNREGPSRG